MKTKQVIELAGSMTALAEILNISVSAICQWGEEIPPARIWQLRVIRPKWFRSARSSCSAAKLSDTDILATDGLMGRATDKSEAIDGR